jgi:lipopolysaccharide/colanic/teichoic acid biosynthesis glycosyltransferase
MSLDELPQIWNVLRGDMSLVGPRPHAVDMRTEDLLGHEIVEEYPHRHRVRPGLTGWAQVHGSRGATETAEQVRERVEFDLYYTENWSVTLDLKILLRTLLIVIRGQNAF